MKKVIFLLATLFIVMAGSAQNDSIGVYAYMDGVYKAVTPIHYQQTKIGVGKASNVFAGSTSFNQFGQQAKFRIFFGPVPLDKLQTCYMFSDSYSIADYGIGEFKVKKDTRLLATVRGSIFGIKSGTTKSDNAEVSINSVRTGVYDVTVTGRPGEYCIMLTRNGAGAYFGVYDFTLAEK